MGKIFNIRVGHIPPGRLLCDCIRKIRQEGDNQGHPREHVGKVGAMKPRLVYWQPTISTSRIPDLLGRGNAVRQD